MNINLTMYMKTNTGPMTINWLLLRCPILEAY